MVHNKPYSLQLWSLIKLQQVSTGPVQQAYTYTLHYRLEPGYISSKLRHHWLYQSLVTYTNMLRKAYTHDKSSL